MMAEKLSYERHFSQVFGLHWGYVMCLVTTAQLLHDLAVTLGTLSTRKHAVQCKSQWSHESNAQHKVPFKLSPHEIQKHCLASTTPSSRGGTVTEKSEKLSRHSWRNGEKSYMLLRFCRCSIISGYRKQLPHQTSIALNFTASLDLEHFELPCLDLFEVKLVANTHSIVLAESWEAVSEETPSLPLTS